MGDVLTDWLADAARRGITLRRGENGSLQAKGPLTPSDRETLSRHKPKLISLLRGDPRFDWTFSGGFTGPNIGAYPMGRCACCQWNAPLTQSGDCVLCEQAERRGVTGRFCLGECSAEPIVGRIDPGGLFCCAKCREEVRKIQSEFSVSA